MPGLDIAKITINVIQLPGHEISGLVKKVVIMQRWRQTADYGEAAK